MKDGYIKKSIILKALCAWWNNPEDTRAWIEVLNEIPCEDIRISKHWNRVTDKLPAVNGNYMITDLYDGELSVHEAAYWDGKFYDPIEQYEPYKNVLAWSGMPEPYKPEG